MNQSQRILLKGKDMKKDEKRTIGLYTKVSPTEKAIIDKKMEQFGIHNLRAYLRKMALNGYIIHIDLSELKPLITFLQINSNNLNQIAKRVNQTGNIYASDIQDIQQGYQKIWDSIYTILNKLED